MGRSGLTWIAVALLGGAFSTVAPAAPRDVDRRLEPSRVSPLPTQVRRVEPAVVGIRVEVEPDRPSAATLGTERCGQRGHLRRRPGYVLTVSYVLLDAERIEVTLRDGRKVPARLIGLDLEAGLGVVKLEGAGPWPAATLGDSTRGGRGRRHRHGGRLRRGRPGGHRRAACTSVRSFAASWEYMLDRAFIVSPYNAAFGGAALVDTAGRVIGVTSLRLGEAPHVEPRHPDRAVPGRQGRADRAAAASRAARRGRGSGSTPSPAAAGCWSSRPLAARPGARGRAPARRRHRPAERAPGREPRGLLPHALAGGRWISDVQRDGGAAGRPSRRSRCARWIATVSIALPTSKLGSN